MRSAWWRSAIPPRTKPFQEVDRSATAEARAGGGSSGLGKVRGAEVGTFLLQRWKAMTPAVRMEAADAMFLDPERPKLLLEAVKADTVQPWTLAFRHKRQLLMSRDTALRENRPQAARREDRRSREGAETL